MESSWSSDPQLLNCSSITMTITQGGSSNNNIIIGAFVGCFLVLALMLAPCVITIILFKRHVGIGTVRYKTSSNSAAKGSEMDVYAVASHTGTTHSETSSRTDPSVMEAPVGDEYSKIQCDNIPPNRHDIQMVAPVGDEYSQLQHENIPPSRHDIQQASGLQYSFLDTKDGINGAGISSKPRGGLTYADVGGNPTCSTTIPMMDTSIVYFDVKCKTETSAETKKHPEADASLDLNMLLIQVADMEHLWESYGEAMGVPLDVLAEVSHMRGENHDKMVEVMDYWFFEHPRNPPPSWREICMGLIEIGCSKLAEDILEVYNTGQLPVQVDNTVALGMQNAMEAPPPLPPKTNESDIIILANSGYSSAAPPIPEKHMMMPAIPVHPPKQAPVVPSKQPILPPQLFK